MAARHAASTGEIRNTKKFFLENLKRKTWVHIENNIKMDLEEREWEAMESTNLAEDTNPMVDCSEHGNDPSGSINDGKF